MKYYKRIVDEILDKKKEVFNAINIVGPKGCGKTRTAKERCVSVIEFQDEDRREGYLSVADTKPSLLLRNNKPILFDEWQDAPKLWGAIRKDCDDNPEDIGSYYLTGSSSKKIDTPHTGTGRISEVEMYPMTFYETGESNGVISLSELIKNPDTNIDGLSNNTSLDDLIFAICRGGWPRCLSLKNKDAQLEVAKDYYRQIYTRDVSNVDGTKRDSELARNILWSYARNVGTLAKQSILLADVQANYSVSSPTFASYGRTLEDLFVIKDIDAWTPQIRSKTAIRSSKKHIFIDPSIAVSALGIGPEYFNNDFDLFGHIFENAVLRDLLVFAEAHNAKLMHYRDDTGLEADAVFQMSDGRYALIEIKRGLSAVSSAEKSLLKFKDVIKKHNEEVLRNTEHPGVVYREPSQLIVIVANANMAYTTDAGVKVVPINCLKD